MYDINERFEIKFDWFVPVYEKKITWLGYNFL